ncbi:MAG: hypothetical protein ACXVFN_03775 [Solirubrobacteraceae bacterium]
MTLTVDPEERRELAAATLGNYAGTPEADRLDVVDAISAAFSEEALEVLTGGPPPFAAAADARAARLARITRHLVAQLAAKGKPARALTRLEVQALFRVPATMAVSIDRRMRAMWPDIDNDLLRTEVTAGIESISRPGNNTEGYRIRITFKSDSAQRAAETLLERHGLLGLLDTEAPRRVLELPYAGQTERTAVEVAVRDVLGLELPR